MTAASSSSAEPRRVPCGSRATGVAALPGSKSLTHRAFALALLSRRPLVVERPLEAEDSTMALAALESFGFRAERRQGEVEVSAPSELASSATIDCGNAGTLFRFLVALAATIPGRWRLDGTPRLRERPAGPLVDALRELGVKIESENRDGFAPLVVHGGSLGGGSVRLDAGRSSQYLSALLLAGQRAAGPIEIEVAALASEPYVGLTVDLLTRFGGSVEPIDGGWRTAPSALAGGRYRVEPDLSAAAYPAAAAALTGGDVVLRGVSLASKQGDRRLLELLVRMGASAIEEESGIRVRGGDGLAAIDDDLSDIPDQVPTVAALAPFARGTTKIRNVGHLRIKESDRLAAMASELRRTGAEVEELADGLVIPGVWASSPPPATPVEIDPHDDHRIAMAMTLVGLRRPNLSIRSPEVVAKSWPGFWSCLLELLSISTEGAR